MSDIELPISQELFEILRCPQAVQERENMEMIQGCCALLKIAGLYRMIPA